MLYYNCFSCSIDMECLSWPWAKKLEGTKYNEKQVVNT